MAMFRTVFLIRPFDPYNSQAPAALDDMCDEGKAIASRKETSSCQS